MGRDIADFEVPHGSATIDHSRDSRDEISFKRIRQPLFDPLHLLLIGAPFAEIDDVGARINVAGLRKVHVSINQSGDYPLSSRVDCLGTTGNSHFVAWPNVANPAAVDHNSAVSNGGTAGAIDQRCALDDNDAARLLRRQNGCDQ